MKGIKFIVASLLLSLASAAAYAQHNTTQLYVVNDPDGYVNLRKDPSSDSDILEIIRNKAVIARTNETDVASGWVPIRYNSWEGYIHQSRLLPISKAYAERLSSQVDFDGYGSVYMLSLNTPNVFVISDGDCGLTVEDLKANKVVLETGIPVCLGTLWGDTLSFQITYCDYDIAADCEATYPMFVIYKVYQQSNGEYDYYTEIFPEPRRVSKAKAQQIVNSIKNQRASGVGYGIDFAQQGRLLFLAYCSGVDAWDMVENSGCDGAGCHEQDLLISMKNAYDRSKYKSKQ